MIKLIVTDMDGSLLTHDKKLPPDFFEVFDELQARGIAFAAASGRTYPALIPIFQKIADKMHFITGNGTNLYINNNIAYSRIMPNDAWRRAVSICENRAGVTAIISGTNSSFALPFRHDDELTEIMERHFASLSEISSPNEVDDEIYQLGICDKNGPQNGLYEEICAVCGNELEAVISGPQYMDVVVKGANKGSALKELQARLKVTPQETMAFGDFFNDIGLFKYSEHSYLMGNAPEEMRQYAKSLTKTNDEHGVTYAIRKFVLA